MLSCVSHHVILINMINWTALTWLDTIEVQMHDTPHNNICAVSYLQYALK